MSGAVTEVCQEFGGGGPGQQGSGALPEQEAASVVETIAQNTLVQVGEQQPSS